MDQRLREYATDAQWEAMCEVEEHGGDRAAERATGKSNSYYSRVRAAVLAKAARHGYAPDHDMTRPTAPGFRVKGTSTLYDAASGEARLQWVKTATDIDPEAFAATVLEAMRDEIPAAPITPAPSATDDDLLQVYGIGDQHLGMLAEAEEAGEDHDIRKGEALLNRAMSALVDRAPPAGTALICIVGDFLHYDGMAAVTPTSGHNLDSDTRFHRMIRTALRAIKIVIKRALEKHAKVHVSIMSGNHDETASKWLSGSMEMHFEDEPRVTVDVSPAHHHYFRWRKCLIGMHHGHGKASKPAQLPSIMATDRAPDWGETTYRLWQIGHLHQEELTSYPGYQVMRLPILPPNDAYAQNNGWRSRRGMLSLTMHARHGLETTRIMTPEMCE